jgi:hypothetical protein
MISRKAAASIGRAYEAMFTYKSSGTYGDRTTRVSRDQLYDFLFENDYSAWLCNLAKTFHDERDIQEAVMRLHTGETLVPATGSWSWEQRARLGQRYLENLAEDFLFRIDRGEDWYKKHYGPHYEGVRRQLELDGYSYQDGRLLRREEDAVEVEEAKGVLHRLYKELALANEDVAIHHLRLSEEHYVTAKWDDCISNSRKFLECVLKEVAAKHAEVAEGRSLGKNVKDSPAEVRDYLVRASLLESKEKDALAKVYGLLSHTGGHPYMAQADQARLLRHLALTFSQFAMLRLQGKLKS